MTITDLVDAALAEDVGPGDVTAEATVDADARGIAVAVDEEVVPRGEWSARELAGGSRIEILTAIQGG